MAKIVDGQIEWLKDESTGVPVGFKKKDGTEGGLVTAETNPLTGGIEESAGGYPIAPMSPNTVVLIGDSRIANGWTIDATPRTNQSGYATTLIALLGDRLSVVGRFAASGKTLAQVLSEQIPQIAAMAIKPRYALMEAGHNDIALDGITGAATIARWQLVYQALNAMGITLLQSTTLPSNLINTAAEQIALAQYNRYLLTRNGVNQGFFCFDGHSAVVDPATGQMLAARTSDNVHTNNEGGWDVGRVGAAFLDQIIPIFQRFTSQPNVYSQLVTNPTGSGSAAVATGGMTGFLPTSWAGSGTPVSVASLVARSDYKTGTVARITLGASSASADPAVVSTAHAIVRNRPQNTALAVNVRVRPTAANGAHYLVTTAGTTANVADPTAGWSAVIGSSVADGTVTYTVVESIDVGDTVELVVEIVAANFNGGAGGVLIELRAFDYPVVSTLLTHYGAFCDTGLAVSAGAPQVLRTFPMVLPAGFGDLIGKVRILGVSGAVIDIGTIEVQKVT